MIDIARAETLTAEERAQYARREDVHGTAMSAMYQLEALFYTFHCAKTPADVKRIWRDMQAAAEEVNRHLETAYCRKLWLALETHDPQPE